MTVYRRMMDKILDQAEDGTAITNPNEPIRTFFRNCQVKVGQAELQASQWCYSVSLRQRNFANGQLRRRTCIGNKQRPADFIKGYVHTIRR